MCVQIQFEKKSGQKGRRASLRWRCRRRFAGAAGAARGVALAAERGEEFRQDVLERANPLADPQADPRPPNSSNRAERAEGEDENVAYR